MIGPWSLFLQSFNNLLQIIYDLVNIECNLLARHINLPTKACIVAKNSAWNTQQLFINLYKTEAYF